MKTLSIEELPIENKKILMRVDFNVPISNGQVTDPTRIVKTLPTIKYVLERKGSLILMSHLGRPQNTYDPEYSLAPCARFLASSLSKSIQFAPDCIGIYAKNSASVLKFNEILLLENLRFHRGEEHPEEGEDFSQILASFGDYYVNEAFAASHRRHSSIYTVPGLFPGKAAAGFLLQKEVQTLTQLITLPKHPFFAIIGGAKISSKIGLLKSLLKKVDGLLIGGAMANTFLKAKGISIGDSAYEEEFIPVAKNLMELAKELTVPLFLPEDFVIAEECSEDAPTKIVDQKQGIPSGFRMLDIGPQTTKHFIEVLQSAKTILWNGPLGVFEFTPFAKATLAIAKAIAKPEIITVIGGGDTIAAVNMAQVADKITHISTGGGATLEFIEHGTLPGIEVLTQKDESLL